MASKLNYSTSLRNNIMAQIITAAGPGAIGKLMDGSQPAGPDSAVTSQVTLAQFTFGSPYAGNPSSGSISPTLPAAVNVLVTGTPTWLRIYTAGGSPLIDGSVGASGCDFNITSGLNGGQVTAGQQISFASFTHTNGNSGH